MSNLNRFLLRFLGKFHKIGLDETVYFSIHHSAYIRGLIAGAVVFYATVVEYVAAYLRAPFDFLLSRLYLVLFALAFLQFLVVEL